MWGIDRRTIEILFGRSDWQLAALIVALVVVPGALDQFEARLRAAPPDTQPVSGQRLRRWQSPSGRHVRPPRSC